MQNNSTQMQRLIIVVVMIISAILMLTILPAGVIKASGNVLVGAYAKYEILQLPLIITAPTMIKFFFPLWASLSMVAGAIALFLAVPVYRGEKWARPLALGTFAIPSIAGAYMLGPIIYFSVDQIYISITYMAIGMISYFVILLGEVSPLITKLKNFVFFALLGVTIAFTFANAHTALRMQMAMYLHDPTNMDKTYPLGVIVGFIGVVITLIGLPILAGRSNAGWWLVTSGLATMMVSVLWFFIAHTDISEFLIGVVLCLASLILLFLPQVGGQLIDKPDGQRFIPSLQKADK